MPELISLRKSLIAVRRLRGFTLIELLVVVAIIALLVAILLPALQEARELAERTVCATNLHGAGLGIHMYANNWGGMVPSVLSTSPINRQYLLWTSLIMVQQDAGTWYGGLGVIYRDKYIDVAELFFCPSQPEDFFGPNYTKTDCIDRLQDPANTVAMGSGACFGPYEFRDLLLYQNGWPAGQAILDIEEHPNLAVVSEFHEPWNNMTLHRQGWNVLYINSAAEWISDPSDEFSSAWMCFPEADRRGG